MEDHLRQHGLALASLAEQVAESVADRAFATELPAALACVEQTLDALSRAYERAAHSLVPARDHVEPWSHRFARAARDWPGARDGVGPSYERQAELLSSLHTAAASLSGARRDCALARDVLAETMERPGDGAHSHAASAASV